MSWMDLKFGAALAMGGTVTAYAIAQQDAGFVLVGLGMIAASTVVWAAYRRGERGRHQEARDTADAALPRPANTIWLTFFVLLMVFMAWTIYRFQY